VRKIPERKGFSLVELLIVLAVIAVLISILSITALNTIRKAKAVAVAQNLKTLSMGFENKVLIDCSPPESIYEIGENVVENYGIAYEVSNGIWLMVTYYTGKDVHLSTLETILPDISENFISLTSPTVLSGSAPYSDSEGNIYYSHVIATSYTPSEADVIITNIEYAASPEVVHIKNLGGVSANLIGWKLKDEANHTFIFPAITIDSGEEIRIYSGHGTMPEGENNFKWSGSYIWNNDGDTAYLYDSAGATVCVYAY